MAKVVTKTETVIAPAWWSWLQVPLLGVGLGVIWWVLAELLRRYVVYSAVCLPVPAGTVCVDGFSIAGNIALVLVVVLSVFALVRLLVARPLIIALASGVVLWGLSGMLAGLPWYETLGWSALIFMLTYSLFTAVARVRSLAATIIIAAVIAIAIRIVLMFW